MAASPPVVGLPTSGAGESSYRHSLPPSPSIPAQPFGSEVGKSLGDKKYCKLLKHYHEVQALLCASRLHADMLRGDLVAAHTALVMAQQEGTQAREDKAVVVSEAVRQAATAALAAAQLQFGVAVNVWVVEQGFQPGLDNNEINDLIESLQPAANGILAKLNMEQILHAHLDP
jgi:hypothetical protein